LGLIGIAPRTGPAGLKLGQEPKDAELVAGGKKSAYVLNRFALEHKNGLIVKRKLDKIGVGKINKEGGA
jgi:hypothetical protein